MKEWMYRYEDVVYADPFDETGRLPGTLKVELFSYAVVRRTDKGAWIATGLGSERFVKDGARKRFACPSSAEARASFIARKQRQIKILEAQLSRAKSALSKIQEQT